MADDKESKDNVEPEKEPEKEMEHEWKKRLKEIDKKKKSKQKKTIKKEDPKHSRLLEREIDIDIKIKPLKILKWIIFILVLILVFYLGRWTAPETTPEANSEENSFSISDFLAKLVPDFLKSNKTVSTIGEIPSDNETTNQTVSENQENGEETTEEVEENEEETEEETTEEVEENEEETIITDYNKVILNLNDISIDWKTTWGKITRLEYSIKNSEEGIIKPDYFLMVVEGYDFEKKVELPAGSKEIKAKTTISSAATVLNGFGYNELNTGDLTSVEITLSLYDSSDTLMAATTKPFNLEGTS